MCQATAVAKMQRRLLAMRARVVAKLERRRLQRQESLRRASGRSKAEARQSSRRKPGWRRRAAKLKAAAVVVGSGAHAAAGHAEEEEEEGGSEQRQQRRRRRGHDKLGEVEEQAERSMETPTRTRFALPYGYNVVVPALRVCEVLSRLLLLYAASQTMWWLHLAGLTAASAVAMALLVWRVNHVWETCSCRCGRCCRRRCGCCCCRTRRRGGSGGAGAAGVHNSVVVPVADEGAGEGAGDEVGAVLSLGGAVVDDDGDSVDEEATPRCCCVEYMILPCCAAIKAACIRSRQTLARLAALAWLTLFTSIAYPGTPRTTPGLVRAASVRQKQGVGSLLYFLIRGGELGVALWATVSVRENQHRDADVFLAACAAVAWVASYVAFVQVSIDTPSVRSEAPHVGAHHFEEY